VARASVTRRILFTVVLVALPGWVAMPALVVCCQSSVALVEELAKLVDLVGLVG